jgi:branched-chain amino acid transport system substrate-binding protein
VPTSAHAAVYSATRHYLRAVEAAGTDEPSESSGPWDYYKIIATIPGDQAFRPAGEDGCPLIKR